MDIADLIKEDLICLDGQVDDDKTAIKTLGEMMVHQGYIKPAYIIAVSERENDFPTGIVLKNDGIAIPHATPADNIIKNGIAVLRLTRAVKFRSMENPDNVVSVKLIFMLALKRANQHLSILQKLFGIFQQEKLIQKLQETKNKDEFCKIMIENLA
ncbi:PTS system galactitol-specific IIA component [Sporomusaceae bacterium BoRhaA]|uniref:PTS sugar transporter subunit IIA n=1 Tax=Pelorhabdus rhamnosifermentans TaxID=2772457 RepID=UPI001C061CBE|nr:PTS sugar transporter subunit IIA [Pelorhabdus rhamnosifermentans]MBU2701381.1 PTS system galactitol-specific IIA component [Pelorhabdus rhamnosifermentans]